MRTWSVTRFRGMISTQPGPTPLSSFNVVSIEQGQPRPGQIVGNSIGKLSFVSTVHKIIVSDHRFQIFH